jgi:hypothetical protein
MQSKSDYIRNSAFLAIIHAAGVRHAEMSVTFDDRWRISAQRSGPGHLASRAVGADSGRHPAERDAKPSQLALCAAVEFGWGPPIVGPSGQSVASSVGVSGSR